MIVCGNRTGLPMPTEGVGGPASTRLSQVRVTVVEPVGQSFSERTYIMAYQVGSAQAQTVVVDNWAGGDGARTMLGHEKGGIASLTWRGAAYFLEHGIVAEPARNSQTKWPIVVRGGTSNESGMTFTPVAMNEVISVGCVEVSP